MGSLIENQNNEVIKSMAKEFLEYRFGIEANDINIQLLVAHINQFEQEVKQHALKKRSVNTSRLKSVNNHNINEQMGAR